MLVIANGAFKSGSTWLFKIVHCITEFPPPPKIYLDQDWYNPSIHPNKLNIFLNNADYSNNNYLSKNHFGMKWQREIILKHENVLVFDIERNLRDVVVSAYYHNRKFKGYQGKFNDFYWRKGRFIANQVREYHLLWRINSPKVYVSSYERLKCDFTSEVKAIGNFLGYHLSSYEIDEIKSKIDKKSKKGNGVFRKGIIGDWQNHFDQEMLKDIEYIEENGLDTLSQIKLERQQPTSEIDLNPLQRTVALSRGVASYYLRWPLILAVSAIALNTAAALEVPFRWAWMTSGTTLLLFLVGHAASKADVALEAADKASHKASEACKTSKKAAQKASKATKKVNQASQAAKQSSHKET